MATVIIAKNQTAGALSLKNLSAPNAEIPASGQVTLTDYNRVYEIQNDPELLGYIDNDQVLLNVDGADLTKAQSQETAQPVSASGKNTLDATAAPGAGNDNTQGYSVGSVWVDVTNDKAYTCIDASTGAAVWQDQGYGAQGPIGMDWQGAWAISTSYAAKDGVQNGGSSYICLQAHTSAADNEPGVGASWETYWDLVAQSGSGRKYQFGALTRGGTTAYTESNSTTYAAVAQFPFSGSGGEADLTPDSCVVVVSADSDSNSMKVRIVDLETSNVICENVTIPTNSNTSVASLGVVSNIPTTAARFEVQFAKNTGKARIWSFHLYKS